MKTAIEYRLPGNLTGTILDRIVTVKVREVMAARKCLPAASLEAAMERAGDARSLCGAVRSGPSPAVISEIKKASPSAGIIRRDFDPRRIVDE